VQLPDLVHGDLDSLRDDVRAYYVSQHVDVSRDGDQDSTDFGKAMHKLAALSSSSTSRREQEQEQEQEQQDVLVLGTVGGRVDQGLGLLHEMMREEATHPRLRLWLFSECSVSFVLRSGRNRIGGLQSGQVFGRHVGIVPLYGPAKMTTVGLAWDVAEWETHMGGQVSTSNHVQADEVCVDTNAPVLFTVERTG